MLLQTVEHEITDIERHSGEESKGCHDIVARQACVDAEIGEVTCLSQTDEQHDGGKVERDDECREKEQDEGYSKPNDGHPLGGEVVAADIFGEQRDGNLSQQQHGELTDADCLVEEQVVAESHAHHEINNRHEEIEKHGAGHSLTVEHKEESQIDKG